MKLANVNGRASLVLGDEIADVAKASDGRFGSDLSAVYDEWAELTSFAATVTTGTAPLVEADLGCPVPFPRQVFAIGLNYRSHAEESGMALPTVPATFTKFPASLGGPFDDIEIVGQAIDWEVELVVVIGTRASRLASPEEALAHIAGYTIGNDVSERSWQLGKDGGQWSQGKSFPTFGPLGPSVLIDPVDPTGLGLRSWVNGEPRQDSSSRDMIFAVDHLVWFLSQAMTLEPGDLVFTGTPEGVALSGRFPYLKDGDVIELEIDGLGRQRQSVVAG